MEFHSSDMLIRKTRAYIKSNLINNSEGFVHNKEYIEIKNLLNRTVQTGESNSLLLIGPRGSGKTALANNIIKELKEESNFASNGIVIQLNGFVHTDDKLALKTISVQMNLDNSCEGKVFGSFAENLSFFLACLRTGESVVSKSVIFILDEFDLFCAHHNQTLLYNLLDVSQSEQTPICIFGITCRLDVIELFEKRVKSRFSHRQIFLFPGQDSTEECSEMQLRLSKIQTLLLLPNNKINLPATFKNSWNANIKQLIKNKDFISLMERLLDIDNNERILKNILILAVSSLNSKNNKLTIKTFADIMKNYESDEKVTMLTNMTVLELCLIIAMKHHIEIYDNQPLNFEMVLSRYLKFINSNSSVQNVPRAVIFKAFQHIKSLEFLQLCGTSAGRLQEEYQLFRVMLTPQQIVEAVKKIQSLPTEVVQWANSSLI